MGSFRGCILTLQTGRTGLLSERRPVSPSLGRRVYVDLAHAGRRVRRGAGAVTHRTRAAAQCGAGPASHDAHGQDYAEIQQLSNRYVWAIDACTRGGYDFADLFTDDGEFGLAEQFGVAPTRALTKGREALANVAGGDGKGGCRDPKTMLGFGISHFVVNHVITPTAGGATGRCYLAGDRHGRRSDEDRAPGRV